MIEVGMAVQKSIQTRVVYCFSSNGILVKSIRDVRCSYTLINIPGSLLSLFHFKLFVYFPRDRWLYILSKGYGEI